VRWRGVPAAVLPRYFTAAPPTERQLLAAVADPSEMAFAPASVDTAWHERHGCSSGGGGDGGGGDTSSRGDSDPAALPECALWPRGGSSDEGSSGDSSDDDTRVPIALVPAELLPALADVTSWVHSELYLPLLEGRLPAA
jgi:hypothetical protein